MGVREDAIAAICGVLCVLYLLNPTGGFIELIPDNIPIIGNLDEAAATAILLASLHHFNIDIINMLQSTLGLLMRHDPQKRR